MTFPILSRGSISFFFFFPLPLLFLVNHYYYNGFTFLPKCYASLCVFVSILNWHCYYLSVLSGNLFYTLTSLIRLQNGTMSLKS